jgi:ankyrin repeat protein
VKDLDWDDVEGLRARRPALVLELMTEGDAAAFRRAVEAGFDVNVASDVGGSERTPAHHAAAADDVDALRVLVQAGADLTATDPQYEATPLGWAKFFEKQEAAEYLRSLGAPE